MVTSPAPTSTVTTTGIPGDPFDHRRSTPSSILLPSTRIVPAVTRCRSSSRRSEEQPHPRFPHRAGSEANPGPAADAGSGRRQCCRCCGARSPASQRPWGQGRRCPSGRRTAARRRQGPVRPSTAQRRARPTPTAGVPPVPADDDCHDQDQPHSDEGDRCGQLPRDVEAQAGQQPANADRDQALTTRSIRVARGAAWRAPTMVGAVRQARRRPGDGAHRRAVRTSRRPPATTTSGQNSDESNHGTTRQRSAVRRERSDRCRG